MWILTLLLVHTVFAQNNTTDWFDDMIAQQTTYVNTHYPTSPGNLPWALLEVCGGNDSADSIAAPGVCTLGPMTNVTQTTIRYSRMVFTPQHETQPVILAFHNVTSNTTTYQEKDIFWDGDYSGMTNWNEGISLT